VQILAVVAISDVRLITPEVSMGSIAIVFSSGSVNPKPSPDGFFNVHFARLVKGNPVNIRELEGGRSGNTKRTLRPER
jgi:hypothetical protein